MQLGLQILNEGDPQAIVSLGEDEIYSRLSSSVGGISRALASVTRVLGLLGSPVRLSRTRWQAHRDGWGVALTGGERRWLQDRREVQPHYVALKRMLADGLGLSAEATACAMALFGFAWKTGVRPLGDLSAADWHALIAFRTRRLRVLPPDAVASSKSRATLQQQVKKSFQKLQARSGLCCSPASLRCPMPGCEAAWE